MFVAGISGSLLTTDTDTYLLTLTIIYGLIFMVVMINILVAVVFYAWDEVIPRSEKLFWKSRHQFLTETSEALFLQCFKSTTYLDRVDRHFNSTLDRFLSRPKKVSKTKNVFYSFRCSVLYFLEAVYLGIILFLGLLSAGLLWPTPFREAIFSIKARGDDADLEEPIEERSKRAMSLETQIEMHDMKEDLSRTHKELRDVKDSVDRLQQIILELRGPFHEKSQDDDLKYA